MKHSSKRLVALLLSALLVLSAFGASVSAAEPTTTGDYHLAAHIKDGAILHAWCWSFNTIKSNLKSIAEAGFTSVQTSPINKCKVGDNGGMQLYGNGKWYYHYQPTLYTIGNYQLGTLAEFKSMCTEADKYGIKIIVDVVANHCTSDYSAIDSSIKKMSKPFHDRVEIENYSNRYQVTQGKLSGLYDLNTQNKDVQNMILKYLKDCIAAGADGFRYDAAKHIELPDDTAVNGVNYKGDFWPTILNNGAEFQYGEILQGGSDRIAAYAEYMNVTASKYGENLRSGLRNRKVNVRTATNFAAPKVDTGKLVTWVESHDNYADGTYSQIDNQQVRQGWAIIAAQGNTTPLFFNRPAGSSAKNQWGNNKIGVRGDDNFLHAEVKAVNHFRNAMIGQEVKVTTLGKNYNVLLIERGDQGAVIVNLSTEDFAVNDATALVNGTYTDEAAGGKFTVKDGTLAGTVKAGAVAVIYNEPKEEILYGDVNGDDKVTIEDATMVQRSIAGLILLSDEQTVRADVNFDNKVTIEDATKIQKYVAQLIDSFK